MTFADFDGCVEYFYHDCDEQTARWAFNRLGPERFSDTTVTPVSVPQLLGRPICRAVSLSANRIDRCRAGSPIPSPRRLGRAAAGNRQFALTRS